MTAPAHGLAVGRSEVAEHDEIVMSVSARVMALSGQLLKHLEIGDGLRRSTSKSKRCRRFTTLVPAQPQVRDVGAILAALGRQEATAFGEDACPAISQKAAALMHSLACNHGWLEGDRRTAWVATRSCT